MKELLQYFIYTEKLLSVLYRKAAALTSVKSQEDTLLKFAKDATDNASYLNSLYKREYGVNYDPMVPEVNVNGSYKEFLDEIAKREIESYQSLKPQAAFAEDQDAKELFDYISGIKAVHVWVLLDTIMKL